MRGLRSVFSRVEFLGDELAQCRDRGDGWLPRLGALARGFHSISPEIYGFDRFPSELYLSDRREAAASRAVAPAAR